MKRQRPVGLVFGAYLVLAGIERFFIEFLRAKDDRFLAGFTTAQAIAVLLILIGATLVVTRLQRRARSSPATSRGAGHAPRPRTAL